MATGKSSRGAARPSGPKEWYSIPQAAEYLRISEPTIFRWMRDGTLSFYKVGKSTRFSKDVLDAAVEKTTSRKEAAAAQGRCASCGHTTLVPGRLQGAGKLYFKPAKSKFWVAAHSLVPTTARACAACGFMQLHADTEKLGRLRGDKRRRA